MTLLSSFDRDLELYGDDVDCHVSKRLFCATIDRTQQKASKHVLLGMRYPAEVNHLSLRANQSLSCLPMDGVQRAFALV
ncbi:hypothetical protein M407DRAFT_240690 [Tulasnella calospora MUT 4182]|uniref:Uncharacterized protein n=1 Tax=Tulasnella calospora MUT 4182 TaxID=1051891 RepID=A0A0C3LK26_9AGAM|nr:hypothetical protein M407DRAFT_240690 [Tulasnella calospora MUT 4182]